MSLSLEHLPDEILQSILSYCSPLAATALERTSRRFSSVTNEPLLWRSYCRAHFQFWDKRHGWPEKLAAPVLSINWKTLYTTRYLIDRTTSQLLDSILSTQTGRAQKFEKITDFGFDAKETVLRNIAVDAGAEDVLARRYYAQAVLACLHRRAAVSEWAELQSGGTVSLERALGAFDLFIPESGYGDPGEISDALDRIATDFLATNPDVDCLSPRSKALTVVSYLRANNLTGIDVTREYHSLEHNFLGIALNDPRHNSLPLISAAIYCYVARRLGLDAVPCGFPFHVYVVVTPPRWFDIDGHEHGSPGQGEPIYLDPFRSELEVPASELKDRLTAMGASNVQQSVYLGKSPIEDIVARCGRNVLNSVQYAYQFRDVHLAPVDVACARYAALWACALLSGTPRPVESRLYLPWITESLATDYPWDIHLVERYLMPLSRDIAEFEHMQESLNVIRAVDATPKQVRWRNGTYKQIKYRVGQVFQHRRYGYTAIITGWDGKCEAGEQWIVRMGVDRLPSGRDQSFYHVLVADNSIRYVAEENIDIVKPTLRELPPVLINLAGKYFKRWDQDSRTFISNVQDEYPNN